LIRGTRKEPKEHKEEEGDERSTRRRMTHGCLPVGKTNWEVFFPVCFPPFLFLFLLFYLPWF
jgi:hypothetical protein